MTSAAADRHVRAPIGTPTDRMLTAALIVAPVLMLGADALYAFQGWDSGAGGAVHVLAAIGYGILVLRFATWIPSDSWLTTGLVFTAVSGAIGSAAYGFEAIHQSLGDMALVDRSGAAVVIKPLGLLFPLALVLVALAMQRLGHRWPATAVLLAAVLWPVAHIANIAPLAVVVNVVLVVALGTSTSWTPGVAPGHVVLPGAESRATET
jgi:hypothetical protein